MGCFGSPYFPTKEFHDYDSSFMSSYSLTPFDSCHKYSPSSYQSTSRLGSCISLLDLEEEGTVEWDTNKVIKIFGSNFPSPIRNKKHGYCYASPNPLEESKYEEPIFWPFDDESYVSQTNFQDDFLRLSPPQSSKGKIALSHTDAKHLKHHLCHSKNRPQEVDCKRRLVFETTLKKRSKNINGEWQKNNTHRYLLEHKVNGCNSCGPNDEVSVEAMVGLNEFDGHEGIMEDLTEDWFSLD